ncbi:DUF4111 domain-containing protein [Clostridium tagluense]|uniref:DUF4111 domain-containing protein n=1 Tax=Clostridium tagluense TaxID=360422 RepID=UPI001CF2B1E4|nr:DUF4111 domain-containing protein [Clostridium tagluense]MCB2313011.1 DUF4111 domain-containing protein [Clostridium tagluense]MCB2332641.1 DUF4111 domain-containing protein [Clostridium tagluense]WAG52795.1 DUF4111 domain-containing protein [Clostridium tagluense]
MAAHITITISRGICIFGKPISDIFEPVPPRYYLESIINDVVNAKEEILDSPIYIILNLCRVLYYLKEGAICSKKEGGEWAYSNVPIQYAEIIKEALLSYKNAKSINNYNPELLIDFANLMIKEMNSSYNLLTS